MFCAAFLLIYPMKCVFTSAIFVFSSIVLRPNQKNYMAITGQLHELPDDCHAIFLIGVFSNKSYVFLHLVLSFLQLATLLLYFTHFFSENILNKLLLAKPTVL